MEITEYIVKVQLLLVDARAGSVCSSVDQCTGLESPLDVLHKPYAASVRYRLWPNATLLVKIKILIRRYSASAGTAALNAGVFRRKTTL